MSDEGFLRRWARRKTEVREGRDVAPAEEPAAVPVAAPAAAPVSVPVSVLSVDGDADRAIAACAAPQPPAAPQPAPSAARPQPTMEDVATLDTESDFSAFVARGVDQAVRRGALKKLFADPHFNVMDKLDVYIDDYNTPSPMSEAMLASLEHAKSVFMKMVEDEPPTLEQPPEQETQ
jgi:hypothetical protein